MMFYSQLSQVFVYSGTLSIRPPSGTLLLRRLHLFYPYTTMIAFLLPYAAGGLGLAGVTLFGFVLSIFRKRKELAM